jgi:pimeloyl-ACP methyl ester carboxylesterase
MHGEVHGQAYATTIIQLWLDSVLRPDELPFTPDDLRRISRPALIVNGDRDPFFPMRVPLTMYEAIPDAELCIMPNCVHSLGDESPTIFVTALLQFLAKHPMA